MKISTNATVGLIAVGATAVLFAALEWRASRTAMAAGFWFEESAFDLPEHVVAELGGALSPDERAAIEVVARRELERAFSGLQIAFSGDGTGFWRVQVVQSLQLSGRRAYGVAGASLGFGPLGGRASIALTTLAVNALRYAPPGATRDVIIEGIGRGVGRAAAHEFAHQIAAVSIDDRTDSDSYEYFSADRASQYYGELRWSRAWTRLRQKVGE